MMRSPTHFLLVLIGGLGLWFASGLFVAPEKPPDVPSLDASQQKLTKVRIRHSIAHDHQAFFKAQGFITADKRLVLKSETPGTVIDLPGKRGQTFDQGSVLVRLALDERGERLKEARALVAQRQLEFDGAQQLAKQAFRSRTRVADAKAKLEAAQADLARIQREISETEIKAPFKGILDQRPLEIGNSLQVGDELATFVNLDLLRLTVYVPETLISRLKVGKDAFVVVQGRDDKVTGTVSFIASIAEPATRTFKVEVTFPNRAHTLLDGMTGEVILSLGLEKAHFVSPGVLSLNDAGIVGIKALNSQGKVRFYPATVLNHQSEGVWLGALPETLDLIIQGQGFVEEGEHVQAEREAERVGEEKAREGSSEEERGAEAREGKEKEMTVTLDASLNGINTGHDKAH